MNLHCAFFQRIRLNRNIKKQIKTSNCFGQVDTLIEKQSTNILTNQHAIKHLEQKDIHDLKIKKKASFSELTNSQNYIEKLKYDSVSLHSTIDFTSTYNNIRNYIIFDQRNEKFKPLGRITQLNQKNTLIKVRKSNTFFKKCSRVYQKQPNSKQNNKQFFRKNQLSTQISAVLKFKNQNKQQPHCITRLKKKPKILVKNSNTIQDDDDDTLTGWKYDL